VDNPFGNFDPRDVFEQMKEENYSSFVNPLMTSMTCLDRNYFNITSSDNIAVEGKDFLSPKLAENEDFYSYNHVLIPYCSSDLWLASEVLPNAPAESNCSTEGWGYSADNSRLQFAFRGKIIFQSIFDQLKQDHGLNSTSFVVMAGSSAGGIGVLNLAQWVRQTTPTIRLRLIVDSAWFINFQGNIARIFDESTTNGFEQPSSSFSAEQDNNGRLIQILYDHPACSDLTFGFPCCVSAQCMLTQKNETTGKLAYFPDEQGSNDVLMFFVSSIYDAFLLAPSVAGSEDLDSASEMNQTQALLNFLTDVGEYGGEMNRSFARTYHLVREGRGGEWVQFVVKCRC